jgi:AcrR family transcriptional regulator
MSSKKEEKRVALLQAALELFAEQGFSGSPTALIAKRAGVASGTLFFHFNSKEDLIRELFEQVRGKVEKTISENIPDRVPLKERFLQTFARLLRYFLDNPDEFRFLELYHFSPFNEERCCNSGEAAPLKDLLLQARKQGLIKDAPLLFLEAVAFGPISSLAKEHANRRTPIDDELVRLTVEACWEGLKS